jgi:uncharacterized protein
MKPETLSLEAISDEPLAFAFELSFSIEALDREPLLEISPVRFVGQVARVEGGYALEGTLAYRGRLECSRCLEPYPFQEQEEFMLLLCPRKQAGKEEVELGKEELDACFYDEPVVPVAPIVEERIQMAVPMKPLCREDCRGLCPHCGQDLNSGECGCVVEIVDPRWEALKSLKQKV